MHNITILWRRELASLFNSPVAYIVLVVFSVISSFFFVNTFFLYDQSDLRALFLRVPVVFLFFVPAITMGLIAREKHSGTVEFLFTNPLSDGEIVLGKYLAAVTMVTVALLLTGLSLVTLLIVGNDADLGSLICGYLGLLLMGAFLCAVGVFTSSLTQNQVIAFIVSFLISATLLLLEDLLVLFPVSINSMLQYVSMTYHLNALSRGVIDTRNLIYFGSGITGFLFLSVKVLESRKWR